MLAQSVAGITYDYDYNVGSRNMGIAISVAFGAGDVIYVLSRQHEQLADVPWHKTAVNAKVGKYEVPDTPDSEELLFEFGKYGDGDRVRTLEPEWRFALPAGVDYDPAKNRTRSTIAFRSSRRMAPTSVSSGATVRAKDSSTHPGESRPMPTASSTWPTTRTTGCRSSIPTGIT